jgi:hypothetical protein
MRNIYHVHDLPNLHVLPMNLGKWDAPAFALRQKRRLTNANKFLDQSVKNRKEGNWDRKQNPQYILMPIKYCSMPNLKFFKHLLILMTSMSFDIIALLVAEPTKQFLPKTTTY